MEFLLFLLHGCDLLVENVGNGDVLAARALAQLFQIHFNFIIRNFI